MKKQILCAGIVCCGILNATALPVAVLDETMPGQDRGANAKLIQALRQDGFEVGPVGVDAFEKGLVSPERYAALVVPSCAAVPASTVFPMIKFVHAGGPALFIGGPLMEQPVYRVGDQWMTDAQIEEKVSNLPLRHRIWGQPAKLAWRRACGPGSKEGSSVAVSEDGRSLHFSFMPLEDWDVFHSADGAPFFGEGDDLFAFTARAETNDTQVSVEIIEKDGSRWIAVAEIGTTWRRVALNLHDFKYWKDTRAKHRGGSDDFLHPRNCANIGIGISNSHTPGMSGRPVSFFLRDAGSCKSILPCGELNKDASAAAQDGVYPWYKTVETEGLVCAIPRTLGEGFGKNQPWRFLQLKTVSGAQAYTKGVCEWLLLERRDAAPERCVAGFGYPKAEQWTQPDVLRRMAQTLRRMLSVPILFAAGTDQFAYWPGETVRLNAAARNGGANTRVSVRIMDAAGKIVFEKEAPGNAPNPLEWLPPRDPADYRVRVSLLQDGKGVDAVEHGFAVLSDKPAAHSEYITVEGGEFNRHGKTWHPVGVNFWPLYVSGMNHDDYGKGWMRQEYYSPTLAERDLAQAADMGITMVSIQAPPIGHERNLLSFLHLCEKYNIYVNLFLRQASPLAFDRKGLEEYLAAAKLAGNAQVLAYDIIWEPGNYVFRDDAARGRWDAAWRSWIDAQYGSVARAEKDWGSKARRNAKGQVTGPQNEWFANDGAWRGQMAAYRRFMDHVTSAAWREARGQIRELDPNHLISFRQGNTLPHDFALTGPVRQIDFICPEGYAVRDTDEGEAAIGFITRYVDATTDGKPVVWAEFGSSIFDSRLQRSNLAFAEKQAAYQERFYRTALRAGASGTVPWWWLGGYRIGERSDYGIVSPNGYERPAALLIRKYAPLFKAPQRVKPIPDVWLTFDRDANAGGYWHEAFHEGAAAYAEAEKKNQMLGVRIAGTDMTSATCPLVALGGVPCDGKNPPKFLDAEFDSLSIRVNEGVWTDCKDGTGLAVKGGAASTFSVRAQVANCGPAMWLPASQCASADGCVLTVHDAEGVVYASAPVHGKVSRLGSAAFEFDFSVKAEPGDTLVFRMEDVGRTPFGDALRVVLKGQ